MSNAGRTSVSPGAPGPGAAPGGPFPGTAPGGRRWLAAAALVLAIACLVPPVSSLAGRYVVAETAQFTMFAMVIPALLVLSQLWRLPRLAGPAGRLTGSGRPPSFTRSLAFLTAFGLLVVLWRVPATIDAVARHQALAVAELATLLIAGTALWLQIAAVPPARTRGQDLARAITAAFAMWLVWIVAYILGFANHGVFHAFRYVPGGALSAVADQELATAVMWAVAGACFLPAVFAAAVSWLRDSDDMEQELDRVASSPALPAVRGWGQPRGGKASPAPRPGA